MIQRIQTVYLIIASALMVFLLFMPIAEFIRLADEVVFELTFRGLLSDVNEKINFNSFPLSILMVFCLTLLLVTIFLFKKRMLQIRLSVFNAVLLVGLQGLQFYYVKTAANALNGTSSYTLFFVFPIVSAILVFLALRAIARDEALVRSLDRLR
jgi:hypothetical protein